MYFEWEDFENIYLEDSYVLGIYESPIQLIFEVEIVLHEKHPLYTLPKPNEQYCYKKGKIIFDGVKSVNWIKKSNMSYTDPDGEIDYGNIETFELKNNRFHLIGDWGEVEIESKQPILRWN